MFARHYCQRKSPYKACLKKQCASSLSYLLEGSTDQLEALAWRVDFKHAQKLLLATHHPGIRMRGRICNSKFIGKAITQS